MKLRPIIRKELLEIMRTKNGLILGIVLLLFAIADPVMLKLTPFFLKEFSGVDLSEFIVLSHRAGVMDFYGDVSQLFTIVFVFVVSKSWIKEVKNQTLVIPVLKGAQIKTLILGKIIAHTIILSVLFVFSFGINYYYSGVLFGFDLDIMFVIHSTVLLSIFYGWLTLFILFLSTFIRNELIVTFISLLTIFIGPILFSLVKLSKLTPFTLLEHGSSLTYIPSDQVLVSMLSITILTVAIYYASISIGKKKEIVKYR